MVPPCGGIEERLRRKCNQVLTPHHSWCSNKCGNNSVLSCFSRIVADKVMFWFHFRCLFRDCPLPVVVILVICFKYGVVISLSKVRFFLHHRLKQLHIYRVGWYLDFPPVCVPYRGTRYYQKCAQGVPFLIAQNNLDNWDLDPGGDWILQKDESLDKSVDSFCTDCKKAWPVKTGGSSSLGWVFRSVQIRGDRILVFERVSGWSTQTADMSGHPLEAVHFLWGMEV